MPSRGVKLGADAQEKGVGVCLGEEVAEMVVVYGYDAKEVIRKFITET
jgi:hypothetical protein